MNEKKLVERCNMLRRIVIELSKIYHNDSTTQDQKNLVETMIGAAIWYLPSDLELWTGKVSEEALKKLKEGIPMNKLTKEHGFPRKLAAKEILTTELSNLKADKSRMFELYVSKYGRWNLVTPKENKLLGKFQKDTKFTSTTDSYAKAGITLISVDKHLIQKRLKLQK
jgi:hypothetical protein